MPKITGWERDYWQGMLPQVERLAHERNEPALAQLAKEVFAYWREERHLSESSIRNPLTNLRNQIKQLPLTEQNSYLTDEGQREHLALKYVRLTQQEWVQLNAPARQKLDERLGDSLPLKEVDVLVERGTRLLSSHNPAEVAVGLALCCGRRFIEVMKTAVFEPKTAYTLWFRGQVKGRSREQAYEIPTLAPAALVLEGIARLRQLVDAHEEEQSIRARYGQAVREAADRHFHDLVPVRDEERDALYTHLLRSVYATIAVYWYAPEQVKAIAYIAEIQGHRLVTTPERHPGAGEEEVEQQQRNYASALHYFDYVVVASDGTIDRRQGLKLGEPGVEVLEIFQPKEKGVRKEPKPEGRPLKKKKGKRKEGAAFSLIRLAIPTRDRFDDLSERMVPYPQDQDEVVRNLMDAYEAATKAATPLPQPTEPLAWTIEALDVSAQQLQEIRAYLLSQQVTDLRPVVTSWLLHEAEKMKQEGPHFAVMPTSQLSRYRQEGATKERLRRAIYAIMQWNRANEPRRRWFLNVSLVKALAGGRKDLIGAVLKEHQAEVDQHHQELNIPRGYNKHTELVQEDIQLPEEPEAYPWNRQN